MPKSSPNQTNFLGGEWSKWAQGRTEDPRYATALATCLNAYPVEEGSLPRRPGTEFIAYPYLGLQPRLLNFEGETAAAYACEFTPHASNGYLRFIQGNTLVVDDDAGSPAIISATDMGNPVKVTTSATPATWSTGDQAILFWPSGQTVVNMGGLQNQVLTLTKVNATHYTLQDMNGVNVDGSAWGAGVLVNAALRRVTRLTTPYTTQAQLNALRIIQNEQLAILVTPTLPPETLSECPTFSLAQTAFVDGPYLNTAQTMSASVSAYTGAITFTAGSAAFATTDTAGSGGTGAFNRHIRIFTEPAAWASGTTYAAGAYVKYNGNYWISNIGSNVGYNPGSTPLISGVATAAWAPVAARGVAQWAWGQITAYTSSTVVTVTLPTGQALLSANGMTVAANNWYLGAYCDSLGYPSCGCYHEGRLWLGGYAPNRFDASTVTDPTLTIGSGFLCFSPTDIDGTVNDSNAISYTLNSKETNPILFMFPDQQGIICGTLGGEFVIQSTTQSDPLTPTDIQAHRVTKYGVANIEPIQAGMSVIFVQRYQQRLMEYLADTFSQRWSGKHLNEFSKHFAASGIAEIAYQEELTPIIWARMNDGTLAGVTYRRVSRFVSENPVFAGWHGHDFHENAGAVARKVTAMCVTPQPAGLSDRLYLATKNSTGHHRLEVVAPLMRETDALTAAWHLDESPASAGVPYFNSCTVAKTAAAVVSNGVPAPYTSDGTAATGGSTPSRSGLAGTGSYTPSTDGNPDISSLLPPAGTPLTGSSGSFSANGPNGHPFNLAFREAVYFDGSTCLYGLPTGFQGATNLSMSFWIPADDFYNAFQGAMLTAPIGKITDYNQDAYPSCPVTSTNPSPMTGFNMGDFSTFSCVTGDFGTSYQTPNTGCFGFDDGFSSPDSTVEWLHVMLAYKASTKTTLFWVNDAAQGSFSLSWHAAPSSVGPSSPAPFPCWGGLSPTPSSFPLPSHADNWDTTFGANNVWSIGGRSWSGGVHNNFGNIYDANSSMHIGSANNNSWLVDAGAGYVSTYAHLVLPGDGAGIITSMTELWMAKIYVDWSVQAYRELFHTTEGSNVTGIYAPVFLGNAGELPVKAVTGSPGTPLIYCSGLNPTAGVTADKAFKLNHATGKNLTVYTATSGLQISPHEWPS